MIRNFQTRTGEKGTCWEAVLSCLLEVSPEAIPYMGKTEDDFLDRVEEWLLPMNLFYFELTEPFQESTKRILSHAFKAGDVYHFILGQRVISRDSPHAVVGLNGKQIWDPHPGSAGLAKVEAFGFLGVRK